MGRSLQFIGEKMPTFVYMTSSVMVVDIVWIFVRLISCTLIQLQDEQLTLNQTSVGSVTHV